MTNVTHNFFYVFIYIFNSLHVSSISCSSSGETNCVNTTSGSCHSVSVAVSYAGRNCASRWSFTKNHYVMHGQQNIKKSAMAENHTTFTKKMAYFGN